MIQIQTKYIIILSILLRIGFFLFGLYQDKYMSVPYTDIDYLVFTDAARFVDNGLSPYLRETYRYTPLLSWMLIPTNWEPKEVWYHFGKVIFMISDIITGLIIMKLLKWSERRSSSNNNNKVMTLSCIWLLNPMVITISTRGSSESVLTVMIMLSLYFLLITENLVISSIWLGLSIHFKIYPIIYLPSILYYLSSKGKPIVNLPLLNLLNVKNIKYLTITLLAIAGLNYIMYWKYGYEFLEHSYLYHLTRIDHRHNFSVYNIALYYKSAITSTTTTNNFQDIEKFAFIPQLLISAIILPLTFAKQDLISSLFLQTFAFVTFNKVMTSQYFIWFLIFLPHFLSKSSLITSKKLLGIIALLVWIGSQASWLYFAYQLEFLGINTFDHGLLYTSIIFFLSNCWCLSVFILSLI
ncbi:GPI14 [[Candida] subhashii]|uniref:GPI mannosyltransferase 1 n=1 Tax=[Candida] subhashii TaxID=561895 RepID=A0A8J5QTY0_9ASCO|nr:GPI14 [[Candida] subhashii]KAG7666356.1 GPI14 [[Candida] subhashii]